mmetsp:Transcript_3666/g.5199  ORF Transcript_3666/g.5199 Transcript_3666/m.5199 type:complete len:185 (+) Transcript_3666:76-630(+)
MMRLVLFWVGACLLVVGGLAEYDLELLSETRSKSDKVLEQGISSLIFDQRKKTTGRRSSPRPQLQCVGGSARGYWWKYPKLVRCTNMGYDGSSVTWKCEGELKDNLNFGFTQVVCEGYSSADDDYVLVGSCGLEYTLYFSTFTVNWVHVSTISFLVFVMLMGYLFVRHYASAIIPKRGQYQEIN